VLDTLAVELDADLFTQTPAAAAAELARLGVAAGGTNGSWQDRGAGTTRGGGASAGAAAGPHRPDNGQAVLATWRSLLDNGSLQDNEPHLAGTARAAVALLAPATAAALGVTFGADVTVATDRGAITVPAGEADLPDGVVWLPANSGAATVRRTLGAGHGALVTVTAAAQDPAGAQ
jgi:NADH-quinone oxidoreductase subunit G